MYLSIVPGPRTGYAVGTSEVALHGEYCPPPSTGAAYWIACEAVARWLDRVAPAPAAVTAVALGPCLDDAAAALVAEVVEEWCDENGVPMVRGCFEAADGEAVAPGDAALRGLHRAQERAATAAAAFHPAALLAVVSAVQGAVRRPGVGV